MILTLLGTDLLLTSTRDYGRRQDPAFTSRHCQHWRHSDLKMVLSWYHGSVSATGLKLIMRMVVLEEALWLIWMEIVTRKGHYRRQTTRALHHIEIGVQSNDLLLWTLRDWLELYIVESTDCYSIAVTAGASMEPRFAWFCRLLQNCSWSRDYTSRFVINIRLFALQGMNHMKEPPLTALVSGLKRSDRPNCR